jgi:hydroxypyruvate isomerase
MKAIVETGFKGHVAHEFTPRSGNAIASVKDAILICDV